jgi:hypothetical protein
MIVSFPASIRNHWIWKDPGLKWWIDILLSINESGQVVKSFGDWGKSWNTTKDRARNFLTVLEQNNLITLDSKESDFTRVTICNFDIYRKDLHGFYLINPMSKKERNKEDKKTEIQKRNDAFLNVYKECIDIYNNFVIKRTGLSAIIDALQGKYMKEIIRYFYSNERVMKRADTDQAVIDSWKVLLDSYNDWNKFNQSCIKINQIYSNITNIINDIRHGHSSRKKAATSREQLEQIVSRYDANKLKNI